MILMHFFSVDAEVTLAAGLRDIGAPSRSPAGNVTYDFFTPNRSESPTQFDARISAPGRPGLSPNIPQANAFNAFFQR